MCLVIAVQRDHIVFADPVVAAADSDKVAAGDLHVEFLDLVAGTVILDVMVTVDFTRDSASEQEHLETGS